MKRNKTNTTYPADYIKSSMFSLFAILLSSCGNEKLTPKPESSDMINDITKQSSIFRKLIELTDNTIPETTRKDSLAFLILPVQASCPSCRNKTIDSIVKYKNNLPDHHYIVISTNGGRKTINSFFRERDKELPVIENKLFLDTTNQAFKYGLYEEQPTMYYTHNKKAYIKVASMPSNIKEDLHQFFSGGYYDKQEVVQNE